jgi:hypothetical protein
MERARDVWEGVLYEAILKRWSISMWDLGVVLGSIGVDRRDAWNINDVDLCDF